MKIEEHDFILESVDDVSHFYNLQLQKVVNKGKANESVKYLIRKDETKGEGKNKKVIPGYTIKLTGF